MLEIGENRAIDLIVAKESGGAGAPRFGGGAGRVLGEHPEGGPVSVKQGRFGAYVNHGKINATIPKGTDPAGVTLDDAVALLAAKAAGGNIIGRLLGNHPGGGAVTVREGRFGPYVNWGKVNATIPKSIAPDRISLEQALDLIVEREGRPPGSTSTAAKAKPAATKKPPVGGAAKAKTKSAKRKG